MAVLARDPQGMASRSGTHRAVACCSSRPIPLGALASRANAFVPRLLSLALALAVTATVTLTVEVTVSPMR